MNENQEKILIPCVTCWKKSGDKNPPIMGELINGSIVHINRNGINVYIEGDYNLRCGDCGSVLNRKFLKEEVIDGERVIKYIFEGSIWEGGGTA